MNLPPAFRRRVVPVFLAVASLAGVTARAVDLVSQSPFQTSGGNADATAASVNSPLELHGIVDTPDGYKFNLCDTAGHINVWIGLNDSGQKFVVRSHDAAHNRVTVEYNGQELTLTLPQPKISSMGMQPQFMPTPGVMPMPQPGQMPNQMYSQSQYQPGLNNPAVLRDERLRLERIAEEIRRRRALRASMQGQPGINAPGSFQPQPSPQP
jgi:hypothetical protein